MQLLIDGDEYLFRTAAAMELDVMWDEWTATRTLNVADAWESVRHQIRQLMRQFDTKDVVFALSGAENWRKDIFPEYKANRAGVKKPCGYGYLRELALAHPMSAMHPRLEADDLLGIRATKPGTETLIVSSDKDMKCLPGALYNPTKGEYGVRTIEEADLFHMGQALTGDTADGYKGCPGMGPVKVEKLLDGKTGAELWPAVVAAYDKAGLGAEEALMQARVARILRHGEFNFKTGEVKLWTPQ